VAWACSRIVRARRWRGGLLAVPVASGSRRQLGQWRGDGVARWCSRTAWPAATMRIAQGAARVVGSWQQHGREGGAPDGGSWSRGGRRWLRWIGVENMGVPMAAPFIGDG
jgi:hypothetical protein